MLGPPNQMETTELMGLFKRLQKLRVEQRWFGIETLEGFDSEFSFAFLSYSAYPAARVRISLTILTPTLDVEQI